jgi:AcrR family transcriptional regulator
MVAEPLAGSDLLRHPLAPALVEVIHERGYPAASLEEVLARAKVERAEFDRHFADKDEASVRVFEAYIDDFEAKLTVAYESRPAWPENLRAAAYETVRWIHRNPDAAWFGMVGALDVSDMALVRREEVFKWCAALVDAGREVAPDPAAVPESAALLAIGAVAEVLRRIEEGSYAAGLIESVPQLMYAAVRPYLGEEAARAELEISPPPDLLDDLG